ncbi:hypothetical protein QJS10_CPB19g00379 [Acorus calamus]|uniref:PAS fold-2 domain-containing protein n=1 Tax=Acorus calamus TaxID=4465 RepID=A0AAV9CFU5_ACOCL|nr:hypothetical protein QJS10_CPB19g00379 [Acorus calamus]
MYYGRSSSSELDVSRWWRAEIPEVKPPPPSDEVVVAPPPPQPNHHCHQKFIGADVRALFISTFSASGLPQNALSASTDPNPLCLTSSSNSRAFHATLHHIDVGVLLDLEPDLMSSSHMAATY